jgi:hypothetical protein
MITNKGKNILAKYLIGQTPSYASHIAIGCGSKPINLVPGTPPGFDDYSLNTELNFEMFRVPIISRGYVNEGGIPKIVFTAELPTEERYQISEIGIYSAAANPSATGNDSKTIFSFSNRENWEQHGEATVTAIPRYDSTILDDAASGSMISSAAGEFAFQTTANNPFFTLPARVDRNEHCRFLNNVLVLRGDESNLTKSTIDGKERLSYPEEPGPGKNHIHINAIGVNLEKNAPNDLLKLAFSVASKDLDALTGQPDEIRIMVEFTPSDTNSEYARFEAILTDETTYGDDSFVYPKDVDFGTNRYYVVGKEIQELQKSSGFSWKEVNTVKIYATVIKDGAASSDYFVCLDALRLDNVATENPIYGLTGYSPVATDTGHPILKDTNTKSFVEFRFAIGIDGVTS